jgi:translation initiation factor IF-2
MPDFVINRKAPIIMGVEILDGQLKMGTPICVPAKEVSFDPPPVVARLTNQPGQPIGLATLQL